MHPLVATVLIAMFVGSVMFAHMAWMDRQERRRNARRVADKYAQPYRQEGRR